MASRAQGSGPRPGVAFLAGALTASVVSLAAIAALVAEIGPGIVRDRVLGRKPIELPRELVAELTALGAVVDNADNPTGAAEHDTILVRPHPELVYELRPGARIDAWQMPAADALNLDPPVVYLPGGARLSGALRAHLDAHGRFYRYAIDAQGHRRTLPEVRAEAKILMVGDSALFGIGVDDEHTIASFLQQLVGDAAQVVNAGVGGYDAARALAVARRLSEEQPFRALVYVAHHNDFDVDDYYSVALARDVIHELAALADRFPDGVVLATVPYLEWVTRGFWQEYGFKRRRIETSETLWRELPEIVAGAGLGFADGAALLEASAAAEGSPFAPIGLYADHAHLAPRGNRLLAERILAALEAARAAGGQPAAPR